jgi:hypothetical protein
MTDSMAMHGPRHAVDTAARRTSRTVLYTAPVLDTAAALLADLWAAGERCGVRSEHLNVAYVCLEAIRLQWRTGTPQTVEEVHTLLRGLVEEFATRGVTARFDTELGWVVIPRGPATPTWGYDRSYEQPPCLAVTVPIGWTDGGWYLTLDLRGARVIDIAAPCDGAAAAVAQLAIEINAGRCGNPFRGI